MPLTLILHLLGIWDVDFRIFAPGRLYLIAVPLACLILILNVRDTLCPFVIDEKGITSKVPFRNIFIPWGEVEYIGVGEQHRGMYYFFTIYFSKIPLKKVSFRQVFAWQIAKNNKQHLFVRYREGVLEEVLKYVDEGRIQNVERIKECPNPHKFQKHSASMKEQERYNSLEILEPKDQKEEE